jgi:hypothetical protein
MVLHRLRNSTIGKMRQQGKSHVHRLENLACRFGAAVFAGLGRRQADQGLRRQRPLIGAKL